MKTGIYYFAGNLHSNFVFFIKKIINILIIPLCVWYPCLILLQIMRFVNDIQLSKDELNVIIKTIKQKSPCNLLIFGIGNDSMFWRKLNHFGKTVFIEDNIFWINKIIKQDSKINVYIVDYQSKITQWEDLLHSPHLLNFELPMDIENESWDIILVDAPEGWNDKTPGRMKSIYLASRLGKNQGEIFVHDCHRQVERIYCDKYLKNENLVAEIDNLRYYKR